MTALHDTNLFFRRGASWLVVYVIDGNGTTFLFNGNNSVIIPWLC